MPVDTSVHEGLHEPQDPSGLGSNLASGPTRPEVPPGPRVHPASGSTWPQVPPGPRLHLATGSIWPQVPPGLRFHLASGSTWPPVPPGLRLHQASSPTWPQVPPGRNAHQLNPAVPAKGFTELDLQGAVNSNIFSAPATTASSPPHMQACLEFAGTDRSEDLGHGLDGDGRLRSCVCA